MKWIVFEDREAAYTIIAVIGIPNERTHSAEKQSCALFSNKYDALTHAIQLKRLKQANEIRVFTPEGY